MSLQRSVAQQNDEVFAEIQLAATRLKDCGAELSWLPRLLTERGQNPSQGLLVRLASVDEQDGDEFYGTWLSEAEEFWEFSVIISRETGLLLEVVEFQNVTSSVLVSAYVPGTGKSFGYLALQALRGSRYE